MKNVLPPLKVVALIATCLILMPGCSNETTLEERRIPPEQQPDTVTDPLQEVNLTELAPVHFTHNGQEFQIIPLYQELIEYITTAREQGENADLDLIYRQSVLEVFRYEATGSRNRIVPGEDFVLVPSNNLDRLEYFINLLSEQHNNIIERIKDSLIKSADMLPGGPTTVFVVPYNPEDYVNSQAMLGVGGIAYENGVIVVQIDPIYLKEDMLSYLVAHEYHHTVLEYKGYRAYTFLDRIILEGKADTFAGLLYPDQIVPWIQPLPDVEHVWSVMKRVMEPGSSLFVNFLLGNRAMGVPNWSNYKIGYQIMQDFLKHNPEATIEEWTLMSADEILEKSKFEERFSDE